MYRSGGGGHQGGGDTQQGTQQRGEHDMLEVDEGGVADDARVGAEQAERYDIEEQGDENAPGDGGEQLEEGCGTNLYIGTHIGGAQHDKGVQDEHAPIGKSALGKIPTGKS